MTAFACELAVWQACMPGGGRSLKAGALGGGVAIRRAPDELILPRPFSWETLATGVE